MTFVTDTCPPAAYTNVQNLIKGGDESVLVSAGTFRSTQPGRPDFRPIHSSTDLHVVTISLAAGTNLAPHTSTSSVLMCVLQGRGYLQAGDERHSAGPGDVVVCPPDQLHGAEALEDMVVLAVISPAP